MRKFLFILLAGFFACSCSPAKRVVLGDEQFSAYLPLLEGKRVALLSNQSGIVGDQVDNWCLQGGQEVTPEMVNTPFGAPADTTRPVTYGPHVLDVGVPILSLYDKGSYMPSEESMGKFDVLVVDIQDVGLRYYTYYVTMQHLLDACAVYGKQVVILDRPNPNGFYVDGPILDMKYKSGIGSIPIAMVHGMTLGELARMMNGEGWLKDSLQCDLTVIPCRNYTHRTKCTLIQPPSPNLKDMRSIYLYASTCFFEGTEVTAGRGTAWPFEIYGHPAMEERGFSFTPRSIPGATHPRYQDRLCQGVDLRGIPIEQIWEEQVNLNYLIDAYRHFPADSTFFMRRNHFELQIGVPYGREMVLSGASADEIRARWADDVAHFKEQRRPYLLYEE